MPISVQELAIILYFLHFMANTVFNTVFTEAEASHCMRLLQRHSYSSISCHLWFGAKNKDGYGVICFPFRGKRVTVTTHRLTFYLNNNFPHMASLHVSHLCHQKACIRIEHLSLEPANINNKRKNCLNCGECTGHYGYKQCLLWSGIIICWCWCHKHARSTHLVSRLYIKSCLSFFLQHFRFRAKWREILYCLDRFLCEW